jgi:hypothetical protein
MNYVITDFEIHHQSEKTLIIACKFEHKNDWEIWSFDKVNGEFKATSRFDMESESDLKVFDKNVRNRDYTWEEYYNVVSQIGQKDFKNFIMDPEESKIKTAEYFTALDVVEAHPSIRMDLIFG